MTGESPRAASLRIRARGDYSTMEATYTPQPYPSWRYHRTEDAIIVNTLAEDEALGEDWASSPADLQPEKPEESETKAPKRKR